MTSDRGMEVYMFVWNIFTCGAGGKYGITNRQDNGTAIANIRYQVKNTTEAPFRKQGAYPKRNAEFG